MWFFLLRAPAETSVISLVMAPCRSWLYSSRSSRSMSSSFWLAESMAEARAFCSAQKLSTIAEYKKPVMYAGTTLASTSSAEGSKRMGFSPVSSLAKCSSSSGSRRTVRTSMSTPLPRSV